MAEPQSAISRSTFGPQHPAAHGVLRLVLELDGRDRASALTSHWSAPSRHRERSSTNLPAGVPYFDRSITVAPMESGAALLPRGREVLGIGVPKRAQLIRVLYSEIGRLLSTSAQRHQTGHGRRRADAAAVGLRRA